jgi:hypothetical protein
LLAFGRSLLCFINIGLPGLSEDDRKLVQAYKSTPKAKKITKKKIKKNASDSHDMSHCLSVSVGLHDSIDNDRNDHNDVSEEGTVAAEIDALDDFFSGDARQFPAILSMDSLGIHPGKTLARTACL